MTIEGIRGVLRGLVPFVQFKKREKHPWRSLILVKAEPATSIIFAIFTRKHLCWSLSE